MREELVTVNMGEVSVVSGDLLNFLAGQKIETGVAAAATALSLVRIMGPMDMDEDAEIHFIENLMQWISLYFHEGVKN